MTFKVRKLKIRVRKHLSGDWRQTHEEEHRKMLETKLRRQITFFSTLGNMENARIAEKKKAIELTAAKKGKPIGASATKRFLSQAKKSARLVEPTSRPKEFKKRNRALAALNELSSYLFDEKAKHGTPVKRTVDDPKALEEWKKKWEKELAELTPWLLEIIKEERKDHGFSTSADVLTAAFNPRRN